MNILAVGAHWDDIELGCCLTLKSLKDLGHNVYCVIMCKSYYVVGQHEGLTEEQAYDAGVKAFTTFGAEYVPTQKGENGKLVYDKEVMQELESISAKLNIGAVFTHWFGDVNTDHRATWEISRTAFRRVDNLLMYQSNSYTDYVNHYTPNCFYGFSAEQYELKRQILSKYDKEWDYRQSRWEREIFERERFWGYLCEDEYAEGFQIGKLVNNYF
jgi:LmbE family N-acetylglucosaminyl deacetylase